MAISNLYPAEGPTLNLNFANSRILDRRITFERTTTGTYMGRDGLIKTAAADEPRFDHRYVNGQVESIGLLIEEASTNYNSYTEDPTQWIVSNMSPSGLTVTLPNGEQSTTIEYKGTSTNADNKFIRPPTSGSAITAGDTWTYSGFYKKGVLGGERYVHIVLQNNTASQGIGRRFDFDNGTWDGSLGLNNVTVADSGYEEYPNGWYRIWLTCTFPSDAGAVQTFTRLHANSTSIPYDTSFSLWGAQLEKKGYHSSYMPSSGAQGDRGVEDVYIDQDKFTSWYNQTEGTVYCEFRCDRWNRSNTTSNYSRVYVVSSNDGFENDSFWLANNPLADNTLRYRMRYTGTNVFGPQDAVRNFDVVKSAFAVKTNNVALVTNGNIDASSTNVLLPSIMKSIHIGSEPASGGIHYLNGHVTQLTYYPTRLSDTQLQNITK